MGKYWLHDFPAEAASRGLQVNTYPGWELRSRGTGGFDGIWGVCGHHTASGPAMSDANNMAYMWPKVANPPYTVATPPESNFFLSRKGIVTLGCAGAANTQGQGGPIRTSRGIVGEDASNRYHVAIEAANNGTGEVWPQAQLDAYLKLVWVLCDVYGLDPTLDVIFHATWAPLRKIDPAGPTPAYPAWGGSTGLRTWNLANFRQSVLEYGVPTVPDMSDFKITNPVRIADTRPSEPANAHNPVKGPFGANGAAVFRPHGFTPADASGVILTLTGLGYAPGYWSVWDGQGLPPGSNLNPIVGQAVNNMAWVPLHNGTFTVYSLASSDIIIDQVGWYWS